jgi:acyl-CoA dehydrogenase
MDLELPEDLRMIQNLAHDFVVDQLKPLERDLLGRSADAGAFQDGLAPKIEEELIRKAMATGLWGASVPEELGGVGLGTLANCLIEEELAQTIVPFNLGDVTPILFECSEPQRQKYLLPALNREKMPYLALMEPGQRLALPEMKTSAHRSNGGYSLNGVKMTLCSRGNDYFAAVFALVQPGELPTCFLVDRDTPGFAVQVAAGAPSSFRMPLTLTFSDCRVFEANQLGNAGAAFTLGKKWMPARRIVRASRSVGVAQRLLGEATVRAQTWQSFGRLAAERPSVQAGLAEMATDIHACRLLVYEAAWRADRGESIRHPAAMVTIFATQMLRNVADRVGHIFGGPPYILGLFANKAGQLGPDTTATLQKTIVARDVLKGLKL